MSCGVGWNRWRFLRVRRKGLALEGKKFPQRLPWQAFQPGHHTQSIRLRAGIRGVRALVSKQGLDFLAADFFVGVRYDQRKVEK